MVGITNKDAIRSQHVVTYSYISPCIYLYKPADVGSVTDVQSWRAISSVVLGVHPYLFANRNTTANVHELWPDDLCTASNSGTSPPRSELMLTDKRIAERHCPVDKSQNGVK